MKWSLDFDLIEIEDCIKKKNEKPNLKLLQDKNYKYNREQFYYKYWYGCYMKKKNTKMNYHELIYLLYTENMNRIRAYGVGKAIKRFFNFQRLLRCYIRSKTFISPYSNMMVYYKYHAGLNRSCLGKRPFVQLDNYGILIIDLRYTKIRLFCLDEDKTLYSLTSGIITKKLKLEEKSQKKSTRVFNVMFKTIFQKFEEKTWKRKVLIYIKGVKKSFLDVMKIINEKYGEKNFIILFNPRIRRNRIKFKKIKSLKKNLLKKFIKSEKRI